jgi:3-dehydroquinate dehydratase / shikimate dehydrogenase
MAQLCVTIGAPTLATLRERRDAAARYGDLVELRLDTLADPDVAGALDGRKSPVIVTCRPTWEGGHFAGSEEERLRLLKQAWDLGAEFVDVEWVSLEEAPWATGDRLVLSSHDFHGIPFDMAARYAAMHAVQPGVVKLAVSARRLTDTLALLALKPPAGRRQVLLAMGAAGLVTRLAPDRFGSAWTYAGDGWAPGQIPADRVRREFRFGSVSPRAGLYGVVARPSGHSVSPAMHNRALEAAGLDAIYVPFEAESADDFLTFAGAMGVRGASVTLPFKIDLLHRVEADELSRRVGAVNTVRRDGQRWSGINTDVAGLLAPLQPRITLEGARATVLGAGGAARAAALALADAGAHVTVRARRAEAARAVAESAGLQFGEMPPPRDSWDVIVNATSAGMHPDVNGTPWPNAVFDGRLVYDLVYNPAETRLLREARQAGCETLGGLDMLVAQAAAQFTYWTGRPADPALMRAAAEERLAAFAGESEAPALSRS